MRSAPRIAFDYRPSRWIFGSVLAGAFGAVVAPWLSAVPTAARIVLSLAASLVAITALTRFMQPDFRRAAYGTVGWTLVDATGAGQHVDLIAHVRIGSLIVLDFRSADCRRFRAVLGPDNLDADTRRRLILLLARAEVAQAG